MTIEYITFQKFNSNFFKDVFLLHHLIVIKQCQKAFVGDWEELISKTFTARTSRSEKSRCDAFLSWYRRLACKGWHIMILERYMRRLAKARMTRTKLKIFFHNATYLRAWGYEVVSKDYQVQPELGGSEIFKWKLWSLNWRRVPCETAIGHELVDAFFQMKTLKAEV